MTRVRPFSVGLTGGIGSGKSAVANAFILHGAEVIDTDAISRALTVAGGAAMGQIQQLFGPEFVAADGGLDRRRMRQAVFQDAAARQRLEGILHPLIHQEAVERLARVSAPYVLLAVPLLVETGGYQEDIDRILVVDCDETRQIARIRERDGVSSEQAMAIIAAQASRSQRLAIADDVIDNNGNLANLAAQVERLHPFYLRCAEMSSQSLP